jgi:hypothetical protein
MKKGEELLNEQLIDLQKKYNYIQEQLDHHKQIEKGLCDKSDLNLNRAQELEMLVHKGKEGERRDLYEL